MATKEKFSPFTCIGLMSGTSMDGVDGAIITTNGEEVMPNPTNFISSAFVPYPPELQSQLLELCSMLSHPSLGIKGIDILALEQHITKINAEVVLLLLTQANLSASSVEAIGYHGQTISHRPDDGITWQLGDGALLSELTHISVVNNLRRKDMAAGGQGAPIIPIYHAALAHKLLHAPNPSIQLQLTKNNPCTSICVLNIGGVANVTQVSIFAEKVEPSLLAFDTGPGNALLNDWVHSHTGSLFDENGDIARSGNVHNILIDTWISTSPYFTKIPPKSLDRNTFSGVVQSLLSNEVSLEDGAATLLAFTIRSISLSTQSFEYQPTVWLVCGGGRHNSFLMECLQKSLSPTPVYPVEYAGWNGDMLEAEGMAFLAARGLRKLPNTFPSTTGCKQPTKGGNIHYDIAMSYGPSPDVYTDEVEDWEMDNPLFWNDISNTTAYEGLLQLREDCTPEERAQSAKEQGNDFYAEGKRKYDAAIYCYTQGLMETFENPALRTSLHANRAMVNLKLENHGKVIADCKKAILYDSNNVKAYFRAAQSCAALKKYSSAISFCNQGLEVDPANKPIAKLLNTTTKKKVTHDTIEAKRQKERDDRANAKQKLQDAIIVRNYVMGALQHKTSSDFRGEVHWDKDGDLCWPVVFAYPEYAQCDFIESFNETNSIGDHLEMMFPQDQTVFWDEKKQYFYGNLCAYYQTNATDIQGKGTNYKKKVWREIDLSLPLLEVLRLPDHIIPVTPIITIFVKKSTYLSEFLEKEINN